MSEEQTVSVSPVSCSIKQTMQILKGAVHEKIQDPLYPSL